MNCYIYSNYSIYRMLTLLANILQFEYGNHDVIPLQQAYHCKHNINIYNNLEHSTTFALWLLLLNCQCVYCFPGCFRFATLLFQFNPFQYSCFVPFVFIYSVTVDLSHWRFPRICTMIRINPRVHSFSFILEMCLTCLSLWLFILDSWSYYHAVLSKSTVSIPENPYVSQRNPIVSLKQWMKNTQSKTNKGII